jgi:2-polyprenyl-3-methyl-5-hydroxy-6-metoxy-1,4-benzoquinol methylase
MGYYEEVEGRIQENLERVVPHSSPHELYLFHLDRYRFAAPFLRNINVLDMGCGSGYGSFLLAEDASEVVGIDVSQKAIEFAKEHFYRENLTFLALDWKDSANLSRVFQGIVALEFLEHIREQENFLKTAASLLTQGGIFILSTPNKSLSSQKSLFHLKEFEPDELQGILGKYFSKTCLYGQFLKPEYKKRRQEFRKFQLYLEQFPRSAIRGFLPKFIRRCIPYKWKISFWKKAWDRRIESEKDSGDTFCSTDFTVNNSIYFTTIEDILITSSKRDILNSDYLLAVCKK